MSSLTISDVKITSDGPHKKVVITITGLVTDEEAERVKALLKKPIYERRLEIPAFPSRRPE